MGYKNAGLHILAILAGLSIAAPAWAQSIEIGPDLGTGGKAALVFTPSTPGSPEVSASCDTGNGDGPVAFPGPKEDCLAANGTYTPGTPAVPPTNAEAVVNSDVKVNGALFVDGRNVGTALSDHDDKNAEQDEALKQHDDKNAEQDEALKQHDGRITKVQNQADATDGRLNSYNGTGNTIEHWSSGVDAWRNDVNEWRGGVDYTLANHGSRLNALEDWRNIAEGQIATLQGDVKRLHRAIAVATALTIPHVDPDKRFALTVSGAGVDGEGAGAIAAAIKFDRNIQGFVGAGTSFSGGPAAVKGGVTFQW